MGNYTSSCKQACQIDNKYSKSSSSTTKVIFPTGEIKKINQPTKAAELMMETPNYFITDSKIMRIGKRFCPLNADDDLLKGNIYVMIPMHKKNYVVCASDLGSLFMIADSTVKKGSGGGIKVQPGGGTVAVGDVAVVPRLSLEGLEETSVPAVMRRMSISRSRKPLLETIDEEPFRSRQWVV
ncbi:uncharacterized protein LOC126668245 [Mercurialis annua]|uniref:uncharacterized protein LOC126668245 n=1 Tax=Mercurialis annua TaxID=3986 RepID=UPI00215FBFF6|nr:uncharacterized protein LOC126668245 [Mercurialis annua]